jgi:hypothetical protein
VLDVLLLHGEVCGFRGGGGVGTGDGGVGGGGM